MIDIHVYAQALNGRTRLRSDDHAGDTELVVIGDHQRLLSAGDSIAWDHFA
jgi:hypothetical protein